MRLDIRGQNVALMAPLLAGVERGLQFALGRLRIHIIRVAVCGSERAAGRFRQVVPDRSARWWRPEMHYGYRDCMRAPPRKTRWFEILGCAADLQEPQRREAQR